MIRTFSRYPLPALAAALFLGCDLQQVQESVEKQTSQAQQAVRQQVGRVEEVVREQLNLNGELKLAFTPPVELNGCHARFTPAAGARPAVLQLTSYRTAETERFPSVFVRAVVGESELAELPGTTASAQVFMQLEQDGPVWHSPDSTPLQLTVTEIRDGMLFAQLAGGRLECSDGRDPAEVSGTFQARLAE